MPLSENAHNETKNSSKLPNEYLYSYTVPYLIVCGQFRFSLDLIG